MNELIQEMVDHYEITKLLASYCHGVDRMDERRASNVYAKESCDDHGPYTNTGPAFIRGVMERMGAGATTADTHLLGQTQVNINGDQAGAETYFLFFGHKVNEDRSEVLLQLGGRYVDKLIREEGCWKITKRVCIRDWSITSPINEDWLRGVSWINGKRNNDDLSYEVLGIVHSGGFSA